MTENYLSQLNEAQRAAVEYIDGPQLVIAGAGSGKTRVLTYKIVHLLSQGMEPRRIMALTFTNKAANEMRERICQLVGESVASQLWMGTFHSIFARILRMYADRLGFKSNYTIYDTSDSKALVKTVIRDMDLDEKVYKPATIQCVISDAKNNLFSPEDYAANSDFRSIDESVRRYKMADVYKAYCNRCRVADAMDFDDLLYYTNVLFRDNPDVLRTFSDYFSYILVDEYQDTNFAQNMIVRQLCKDKGNLCVVGDDAQSIYSFRGANIRNILDLGKWLPSIKTFKLEQNYRSTKNIIGAANSLIARNQEQIPKEIYSTNVEGERIEVVQSSTDHEEAYVLANRISQIKMRSRDSYQEFAVLYRTNAQSRILEEKLRSRNIPYRIYGGLAFYQRKEIKDAIAYFRLAVNPNDDESVRRIINYPARGIGETTLKKIQSAAIRDNVSMFEVITNPSHHSLDVNKGTLKKISTFAELLKSFIDLNNNGMAADELAKHIIAETGILKLYISDKAPESISKQENILELLKATTDFVEERQEQYGEQNVSMTNFISNTALLTDQDIKSGDTDCVTLMTIHAAKGLEFSNVYVVGVEEDLLPSSKSQSEREIEEERRLMYVAITRAKKFCMLSFTSQRTLNGQTRFVNPSRFLREIDRKYLRLVGGTNLGTAQSFCADAYQPVRSFSNIANKPYFSEKTVRSSVNTASTVVGREYSQHTYSELEVGKRIDHPRFGKGVITAIDASQNKIIVQFNTQGEKTLLLTFAKFAIL